jgi:glucosamine-phosphate N-acetyltransferase
MVEIKELSPRDVTQDLLDILHDAFKHPNVSVPIAKKRFRSRQSAHIHTFGIYLDSKLIGTASVLIELKLFGEPHKIAHVEDVAICKDLRGFGYGKKLMEYIKDFCKKKQCRKIVLYCSNDNVAFYKKLKFRNSANLMRLDLD